jgi:hypothetical protein
MTDQSPSAQYEDAFQLLDDSYAELIASLTPEDIERLWSVLIQIKPDLKTVAPNHPSH